MNDAPRYVTLRDYLRVLRDQRLLIVLITAVFAGAAVFVSVRQTPTYQAEASLAFEDVSQDSTLLGTATFPAQTPEKLAAVSAETINRTPVALRVKRALKSPQTVRSLQDSITTRVEAQTNLVIITARAGTATGASRLANEFARQAQRVATQATRKRLADAAAAVKREARRLEKSEENLGLTQTVYADRIARLQSLSRFATPATIASFAQKPVGPTSPKPVRNGILGGLLGLTLGMLAAFVRDSLDRRLRSAREIQEQVSIPLLGSVRNEAMGRAGAVRNGRGPMSDADLESFRILRTNIEFLDVDKPLRSIVVTSALPEEGKSTVAASLAFASAAAGKRTLLLECDLRRPSLASRLGINSGPGLTEYLAGQAAPSEVLQTIPLDDASDNGAEPAKAAFPDDEGMPGFDHGQLLVCIAAGKPPPRPAELLGSNRFRDFLEQISTAYDTVVLDSAPLLAVVDTLELLPNVDGVIVCVRASKTTRDQVRAAKHALEHLPERPMGLVVTGIRSGDESDYGYYYSTAYHPAK